jgi:flavin reductase (DIM6/NTAB) family NADH-FMN oxidoreductase RutF
MTVFKEIAPETVKDNVFKLIGSDWMLITAGDVKGFNTMTASWGGLGVLWSKNVCFCVIRPSRYTFEFMEKNNRFTLSFFDDAYRGALTYCGSKSGRDVNKVAATKLTPVTAKSGGIYFAEARLVFECKKMYFQDIVPAGFCDAVINENYPQKDYHRLYVGEIVRCLSK